ncbi:MAG: M1 family aminopeptidase/hydrolase, partial [Thermoanaerobaculia bacterium]
MRFQRVRSAIWVTLLFLSGFGSIHCGEQRGRNADEAASQGPPPAGELIDAHSFSRPNSVVVTHLNLSLEVDFDSQRLVGRASWNIDNLGGASSLHLDSRDLDIRRVSLDQGEETTFELREPVALLGSELVIQIKPETKVVHIDYASQPQAEAVQWLAARQTAGGKHSFLFTQSQAILARTWVPCQDSPGVRFTYDAEIKVPAPLLAVMSASNPVTANPDGVYRFSMPQTIPSYLLALAVGDLRFSPIGPRSGVYAEPSVVDSAAWEFGEVESMIDAAEALYGPYRWDRFDILVLPPSFPFGGMENPRLTFATPTILAGDRSLVSLVAHELAHSWSGNLVTNKTWNDFWLNEGFTSYFENRIMESVKGAEYAEMLRTLSLQDLAEELATQSPDSPDTHLLLDLRGRNPDDGMTAIAYDTGAALLRLLEEI